MIVLRRHDAHRTEFIESAEILIIREPARDAIAPATGIRDFNLIMMFFFFLPLEDSIFADHSWFTKPLTYASSRTHLLSRMVNV
jgi:hypothetical protein